MARHSCRGAARGLSPTEHRRPPVHPGGRACALPCLDEATEQSPPRCWGLAVQLYSLRRPGDGGYGDCLALEQLARAAAERGADALAISPIHALSAIDQRHYSPYSPPAACCSTRCTPAPPHCWASGKCAWRSRRASCSRCSMSSSNCRWWTGPAPPKPGNSCCRRCTRTSAGALTPAKGLRQLP